MEVVQSKKNNKFLLDFLDHVKKQIKEKIKLKFMTHGKQDMYIKLLDHILSIDF